MEQGRGVVAFFDEKANYGFIEPDDDSGDVVFSVPPGGEPLQVGDMVVYDLVRQPSVTTKGPEALRVRRVGFAAAQAVEA
jgi:cold shock CspA family protein